MAGNERRLFTRLIKQLVAAEKVVMYEIVKANEHLKRLQADLKNYGINVW